MEVVCPVLVRYEELLETYAGLASDLLPWTENPTRPRPEGADLRSLQTIVLTRGSRGEKDDAERMFPRPNAAPRS